MKLFFSDKTSEIIKESSILIDNDFLSLIYHDEKLLKEFLNLLSRKQVYLYPLTEFEFLRDVYDPKQRILKEKFIAQQIFGHIKPDTHMKVFSKLLENALILSKIFAHQTIKGTKNSSSFIDLLLAAFLMFLKKRKIILITGNKKDFPSCVFDTVSVLNSEQEDGNMRSICIIEFNQNNFDSCYSQLKKMEEKYTIT